MKRRQSKLDFLARGGLPRACQNASKNFFIFLHFVLDFSVFFLYTIRIESKRLMRTREEVQEEQRRAQARAERWNESIDDVRQLQLEWQRDNEAHLGPFLHPVEGEEN